MKSLEDQLFHSLNKIVPNLSSSSITVALSMGCDSTALFYLLYNLKFKINFKLSACHLNHGIRIESDFEQKEFIKLMNKYEIPFYTEKLKIPQHLVESGKSFETWAREERYKFYKKAKEQLNSDYIALAHIKEDIIETFYLNLFRGSGLSGASSIPPKRDYFIRPLLDISKEELKNYLNTNSIEYFEDITNQDIKINRNYIRNQILPIIHAKFPQSNKSLLNFIEEINITLDFINSFIPEWFNRIYWIKDEFLKLLPYIQRYILYKKIKEMTLKMGYDFSEIALSKKNINEIIRKLNNILNGYLARFSIFDIYIAYGKIFFISKENSLNQKTKLEFDLIYENKNQVKLLEYKTFLISIQVKDNFKLLKNKIKLSRCFIIKKQENFKKLIISEWENGDRIKLSEYDKKLQDIFVDWKVPSPLRKDALIIRNEKDVIGLYLPYNFGNKSNFILSKDYYVDFNENFDYILITINNKYGKECI